jgi:hypothetical protein
MQIVVMEIMTRTKYFFMFSTMKFKKFCLDS